MSYIAGAELPCVILNVVRGGPGLGTIQPSQSDYFQAVRGGGHGDYKLLVLAPASVQEMADFTALGFELAFKYRNPVMLLSDGAIGQMMEKVLLPEQKPRRKEEEIRKQCPWASLGKQNGKARNAITSLELDPLKQEQINLRLQAKYEKMKEQGVRFEEVMCDDAEYLLLAFGTSARICQKTIQLAREKGIKVGLLRPITLCPFPEAPIAKLAEQVKGMLVVEMNAGQMIEDVRLSVLGKVKVEHFGRLGGVVPSPAEVLIALEQQIIGG